MSDRGKLLSPDMREMGDAYSIEDLKFIESTVTLRDDFDKEKFRKKLQVRAYIYAALSDDEAEMRKKKFLQPSTIARKWGAKAAEIERISEWLNNLNAAEYPFLRDAGKRLVASGETPPDYPAPEAIPLAPIASAKEHDRAMPLDDRAPPSEVLVWRIDEQIKRLKANLAWFAKCAAEVAAPTGNQIALDGDARSEFLLELTNLYIASAAQPVSPFKNRETGAPAGEFMDFALACFSRLKKRETPLAIYALFYRVVPSPARPSNAQLKN